MRILVTTTGPAGHFGPLVPFAEAVREAGDDVLVAVRESHAAAVAAAGFDTWSFADADPAARGAVFASLRDDPGSAEANRRVISEVFAGLDAAAALPRVLEACSAWRPDLVLSETCEFAGGLAAEHAGVPGVRVGITLGATEAPVMPVAASALAGLRDRLGLPADPDAERLLGAPYFTLAPLGLEDPAMPGVPGARRFRENGHGAVRPLPDWWANGDTPLVYLTFGTVAPSYGLFPDLYRAAIDALAPLAVRLLVTTGRNADPAELGPLPPNVHAERWVAQADVMPHAAAMVCHGGFGTVRAGLAAGVPLAVLPLFADQPANADRVADLGAGVAVPGGPAGVARLGEAVEALLAQPSHRARAAEVAAEVLTLPTVDQAAEILRDLARA